MPAKGRDRLLSLRFLSDLSLDEIHDASSDVAANAKPTNAYEFMSSRRDAGNDPIMKRWNASIRLSNFASAETSPLCVSASNKSSGRQVSFELLDCFCRRVA